MSGSMDFDHVTARRIEAAYTSADVVGQRRAVLALLAPAPGERMLDVGAGPGFLCTELAESIGVGGAVVGLEPSAAMRALADRRIQQPGSAPVDHIAGEATSLPFPDGTFDAVTSTQVYEYVDDVPAALAEARRVLRPGGRLFVLDTDWDSLVWHSSDPERMRRVLAAWDQHLVDPHLPRRLPRLLRDAAFSLREAQVFPLLSVGWNENSLAAGVMELISAFVPGRGGITPAETEAWADDLRELGADFFFSINRYLFLAERG